MARRLELVLERLIRRGLRCGIVLKPENIYYLTGYYPSSASALVISDEPILLVSKMDRESVSDANLGYKIVTRLDKELKKLAYKKIAIEKNFISVKFLEKNLKNKKVYDLNFLDEMRRVKDRNEIKSIEKAVMLTEEAFGKLELDHSEIDASASLEYNMRKKGQLAFEAIVAGGANSAVPHHISRDTPISMPVIVDAGARVERYNADITRTFLSSGNDKEVQVVYDAVKEAQLAGINECRHGNEIKRVDIAVRAVLKKYGFEKDFLHSSGHGIGLSVHEEPRLSRDARGTFQEGMVVTVEPGVYRNFGVRIEDVVLVGKRPKVLSKLAK
ncbi:MAG: M24 family metallopeptidase [Candidatus Hydrothermarchaeaceae archaeon]